MWQISRALQLPLDSSLKDTSYTPYTISYVCRKRLQVDNFNELPEEKRPPERMIWDGSPEELDDWIKRVFSKNEPQVFNFDISEDDIG